jgi:CRISPR-associated endonuclease/helicase Cas3
MVESGGTGKPARRSTFGIGAMDRADGRTAATGRGRAGGSALLPAHVDMLAQTSVRHGINVAPWLHGWKSGSADVYLCWRADWAQGVARLAARRQHELLAVPLYALRRWSAADRRCRRRRAGRTRAPARGSNASAGTARNRR